jgi:predicted nucleotidyltransferase component of viral defense system
MSKGDSTKAQIIIRNYVMERFLERLSLSSYSGNLILKGGILVSAMMGIENRSTMDLDATIRDINLTEENARKIVEEITKVALDDGMTFEVVSVAPILGDADYPGIRVLLETMLETMRTPLKIDFSTGDAITPSEIVYSFRLLFEDRSIPIMAYNLETILAEKIETLLTRGTANSRMRDFYDIYALSSTQSDSIDAAVMRAAFKKTSDNRGSSTVVKSMALTLDEVESSPDMVALWKNYQNKFDYAAGIAWEEIMKSVRWLCEIITPME